jgi:AcrR family transcriptional regulator
VSSVSEEGAHKFNISHHKIKVAPVKIHVMCDNMKKMTAANSRKRTYNQTARAEAAEATAARIVEVFHEFLKTDWYDDISLDQIAKAAGVTVPTVLRRFGSKEGLLGSVRDKMEREVDARRMVTPGDVVAIVDVIINDYEASAEMVLRVLAQEDRLPTLRELADYGRNQHRIWLREVFAPQLAGRKPAEQEWMLDGLMGALDIYVWKVLRQDRGRTPPEVAHYMRLMVKGILDGQ